MTNLLSLIDNNVEPYTITIGSLLLCYIDNNIFASCYRTIKLEKLVIIEVACTFDLHHYPFDNQECFMILVNKGNNGDIVQLVPALKVYYIGDPNFLYYTMENPEMLDTRTPSCQNNNCDKYTGNIQL